jgi:hypothetical protein
MIESAMGRKAEFVVTNARLETKVHFFIFLDKFVTRFSDADSWRAMCLENEAEGIPLGFGDILASRVRNGVLIAYPGIYINESDFVFDDGSDYRDLAEYTKFHEMTEIWMTAARGLRKRTTKEIHSNEDFKACHRRALIEEWAELVKKGGGDRYLEFLEKLEDGKKYEDIGKMFNENQRTCRKVRQVFGLNK